ncbi:type IV pilin N-terminal domain-containing protein [Halorubrum salinum]|uniref:type IV pilin N-terminal domain-containing protein n=1 Tax=Halorubrum salinum TaxID=767517 RepID=UPI0021120220|nr:type IV pilin N-terminal domain-containing protein [Halorubrum salinum]
MVRPSRRDFLGGSALTLAALTGFVDPEVDGDERSPDGTPADLDVDVPAPFADAFLPVPAAEALSTTYATVIADRVDADATEDLSYRARSATETLGVDADALSATVSVTPSDRGVRLLTAAGSFDRVELGETIAVGESGDAGSVVDGDRGGSSGPATDAETTDELPAGWRLADDGDTAVVAGEGVAAATAAAVPAASGAADASGDEADRRIETARIAGRTATGEVDRLAESAIGEAALPRLGGFETVLLVPDADGGPFPSRVPGGVDAFAAGFETAPADLRELDGTAENAYVIRTADDASGTGSGGASPDDDAVERFVRAVDPAEPVETDVSRADGLILVDVTVEAPPELDREAAPDADVRSRFDREEGTVTFEHRGGEAVPADELEVWHDGEDVSDAVLDGGTFEAGDALTVDTGRIGTVTLRWFDAAENAYYTYASERVDREAFSFSYDMDAETLELTYEGERAADPSDLRLVHRGESGARTVGEEFTDATLEPGDEVVVDDVSIGDSVRLEFDVETPPGVGRGSLAHYRASPPHVWIHSRAEEGTTVRYAGEESRPADAFVTLVDGEPTDAQFADEHDSLSDGDELVLGELRLGSAVAVEWREPDEPVVVAEQEVVPNTRAEIEYDPDAGEVTVRHRGGRTLPASELELQAGREPTGVQPADELDEFGPDDAFTAPVPPLSRVRLVWVGGEREHHLGGTTTARDAVIARYDAAAEEMTVEYVGDRPVDPSRLRLSVTGSNGPRGRESERESRFAAEHDELTAGDAVTVDGVAGDDTVVVSVHTEFENGAASSSVGHFPATPRRGFVVEDGGRAAGGADGTGGESAEGGESASGTTLRYLGEVHRDSDAFRVLVDGEPAEVQPSDVTDRLTGGETLTLGGLSAGTTVAVEWTAGDRTRTVTEHVIPPQATFDVAYDPAADGDGGDVTFTHAGGDAVSAEQIDVVVEPGSDGLRPWDADGGEVTAGDETTVAVDEEPHVGVVVFNDSESLHQERFDRGS